jgi:predicted peptidase
MRRLAILLIMCVGTISVAAQIQPEGSFLEEKGAVEGGYNFWVYMPKEYEMDKHPLPLIVFLHGASLCGKNLQKVRRYGVLDAIDKGLIMPMFVLAPQNSGGAWSPRKINDLIEWMKQNYAIDSTRVFVLGMSLGGYGTLDFVGTYPEKVAAAMALCGGTTLKDVSGMGKTPLWIMHGTADRAVNIRESKKIVEALTAEGNDKLLRYDWLKGASHGTLARLFYLQQTYDWLLSHSLSDNPRTVDRDIDIGWEDIKSTYQQLKNNIEDYDND